MGNTNAYKNGKAARLAAYVTVRTAWRASAHCAITSVGAELGQTLNPAQSRSKAVLTIKLSDTNLQVGDATETFASAPVEKNGVVYAPVKDICQALSWQTGEVAAENGDLIIISQAKKS
ncbi:MAG: hypothetical protein ACLT4C_11310 [Butyricicoccus sp.]